MPISVSTDLDYLLEELRLQLGDVDSTAYRYTDEWLTTALVAGFKTLSLWWNYKYIINTTTYVVTRNPNHTYIFPTPPTIQTGDDRAIVLMSSIIIKEGTLENLSYNLGAWNDAEISYSNIEGSRSKNASIQRDWDELMGFLKPPAKRLAQARRGTLPGYKDNQFEQVTEL